MKNSTFKKVLAGVMCIAMIACLGVTSFAADLGTNQQQLDESTTSGDTIVWYQSDRNVTPDPDGDPTDPSDISDNYEVIIPEKILATKDTSAVNEYAVSVPVCLIHPGKQLDISCAYDGEMIHSDSETTKLTYKMQNGGSDFATGAVILTVAAGDPTPATAPSTNVRAILTMAPLFAGVYEGTATFTCAVNDAA